MILESEKEVGDLDKREEDVVIFFIAGIWVEVLLFTLVRRNKIRIPNLRVAKTTIERKVQSAFDKGLRQLSFHKSRRQSLCDDVPSAVQRDYLMVGDI